MDFFPYNYPLFRPPSEAYSLIFQITIGCSRNQCTFCGMYKDKIFRLRSVAEIIVEMQRVPAAFRQRIQRVFLADGDALVYPQAGLEEILAALRETFPNLRRVGSYASPASLAGKDFEELRRLRQQKLRILYFGLESADPATLQAINKGFSAEAMLEQCRKAQSSGLKLSVTAILGLAGKRRSLEHARATGRWITALSPAYFSLLTLFVRRNDDFLRTIQPLSRGEILEEAQELLLHLAPEKTILRSNHVSNFIHLAGSYPKDRQRLLVEIELAIRRGRQRPDWYNQVPDYLEDRY
ncbi:MAG: radical SAM protein [Desulfuromonadaceae bacterium]